MFKNFVIIASMVMFAACGKTAAPVETPDVVVAEEVVEVLPVVDVPVETTPAADTTATQVP